MHTPPQGIPQLFKESIEKMVTTGPKDKRKKSEKDKLKSREAAIDRAVVGPSGVFSLLKKLQQSSQDFRKIQKLLVKLKRVRYKGKPHLETGNGGIGGRTKSDVDKAVLKRIKGKSHLKHGGKAKKKYGVVGKPKLRKGGKAK